MGGGRTLGLVGRSVLTGAGEGTGRRSALRALDEPHPLPNPSASKTPAFWDNGVGCGRQVVSHQAEIPLRRVLKGSVFFCFFLKASFIGNIFS